MVNKISRGVIVCALIYMLILLFAHSVWTHRQAEIREHELRTWNDFGVIEVINKQY